MGRDFRFVIPTAKQADPRWFRRRIVFDLIGRRGIAPFEVLQEDFGSVALHRSELSDLLDDLASIREEDKRIFGPILHGEAEVAFMEAYLHLWDQPEGSTVTLAWS
jgi:hypothetical protein